jgi:hypothetical protein
MNPMSLTYHESVMAELRREADAARRIRCIASSREGPHRFSFRAVSARLAESSRGRNAGTDREGR